MKLLLSHRTDLLELIEKYEFDAADFRFIKTKGRIRIQFNKDSFSYFRKKQTKLDSHNQWKNSESFLVSQNGSKEIATPDWSGVLQYFDEWLTDQQSSNA